MTHNNRNEQDRIAAIFDLDYTVTNKDTYLSFLRSLLRRYPARLIRSSWLPFAVLLYKTGLRDNHWLKRIFLQTIAGGMTSRQINECTERFLDGLINEGIRPGALEAINKHKQANHQLILATASFDFYAEKLGRRLGFDAVICTRAVWHADHRLHGGILDENCYGPIKLERLMEFFGENRHRFYLFGYSDHHADEPLLHWVDQATAVNPTTQLTKIARQRNFSIVDWD